MSEDKYKARLRAVLQGLECEEIAKLMEQNPETLKRVASQIARAAARGAFIKAVGQFYDPNSPRRGILP